MWLILEVFEQFLKFDPNLDKLQNLEFNHEVPHCVGSGSSSHGLCRLVYVIIVLYKHFALVILSPFLVATKHHYKGMSVCWLLRCYISFFGLVTLGGVSCIIQSSFLAFRNCQ